MTTYTPGTTALFEGEYRERGPNNSWFDVNGLRADNDAQVEDYDAQVEDFYTDLTPPRPVAAGETLDPSRTYVDGNGDKWKYTREGWDEKLGRHLPAGWNFADTPTSWSRLFTPLIAREDGAYWHEILDPRRAPTPPKPKPETLNVSEFDPQNTGTLAALAKHWHAVADAAKDECRLLKKEREKSREMYADLANTYNDANRAYLELRRKHAALKYRMIEVVNGTS